MKIVKKALALAVLTSVMSITSAFAVSGLVDDSVSACKELITLN